MHAQRVVVAVAAGAGMLATFLPWVEAGPLGSMSGTHGDWWITLVVHAIALASAFVGERAAAPSARLRFWMVAVGVITGLVGLYVHSRLRVLGWDVIGPGVYLDMLASIVVIVAAGAFVEYASFIPTVFALLCVVGTVLAGFVHFAYNGHLPVMKVCAKSRWSIADTFANLDDYIGGKRDEFNAPMVDALAKCGLLQVGAVPNSDSLPSLPSPPDPNIGKRCIVEHADVAGHTELGTCRELSTCTTYYYQGACTGDANIICCIDKRI